MLCLAASLLAAAVSTASAQGSWPLWESYNRAIVDQQGRVIDHSAQDQTTSEGQSYAMFFALVANDRVRFDKILHWTEINLAGGDLSQHLPSWSWGKSPDGQWKSLDQHPASDADLWMAYSLIEAGRLWHDTHYDRLGMAIAAQVAQQEAIYVPGLGTTLLPGPLGFHPDPQTWIINPSYLQPSILARLTVVMPNGPWAAILNSLNPILTQGSGAGWAMDWVLAGEGIHPTATPTQHAAGNGGAMPIGGYEAIRVYLWLGIADPDTRGVRSLLSHVSAMATYLGSHLTPPQQVDAEGKILNADSPPGFSAAVAPYLKAAGKGSQARTQFDRLEIFRNPTSGLYGKNGDYYDQNLALFATGWLEGRYHFDRNGMLRVKWR
jgi:endoglucanase